MQCSCCKQPSRGRPQTPRSPLRPPPAWSPPLAGAAPAQVPSPSPQPTDSTSLTSTNVHSLTSDRVVVHRLTPTPTSTTFDRTDAAATVARLNFDDAAERETEAEAAETDAAAPEGVEDEGDAQRLLAAMLAAQRCVTHECQRERGEGDAETTAAVRPQLRALCTAAVELHCCLGNKLVAAKGKPRPAHHPGGFASQAALEDPLGSSDGAGAAAGEPLEAECGALARLLLALMTLLPVARRSEVRG